MKIKKYTVEIYDGSGIIHRGKPVNEFKIEEFNVIAENSLNLVVDDLHFTTIRKAKQDYTTCLGVPYIGINSNDSCWGNSIRYTIWTFTDKKAAKIRAEIQKEVNKKFGFFLRGFDLSFIKEQK